MHWNNIIYCKYLLACHHLHVTQSLEYKDRCPKIDYQSFFYGALLGKKMIEKQGYKSREKIIICKIWIVSCKDDTTVLKSLTYFIKKSIHRRIHSKTWNGVQKMYPGGTKFFEVQNSEMGYCTPKWGTVGNPATDTLMVIFLGNFSFRNSYLIDVIHNEWKFVG